MSEGIEESFSLFILYHSSPLAGFPLEFTSCGKSLGDGGCSLFQPWSYHRRFRKPLDSPRPGCAKAWSYLAILLSGEDAETARGAEFSRIRSAICADNPSSSRLADRAKTIRYSATSRFLKPLLHLGEGFSGFVLARSDRHRIVKVLPQAAVFIQINKHRLFLPLLVHNEIDSAHPRKIEITPLPVEYSFLASFGLPYILS